VLRRSKVARARHPDRGGNANQAAEINAAFDEAKKFYEVKRWVRPTSKLRWTRCNDTDCDLSGTVVISSLSRPENRMPLMLFGFD